MRILFLAITLIFIYTQPAHSSTIKFTGRFAVVNSERVFGETNLAKSMVTILQSEFTARHEALRDEARSIVTAASELDRQANQFLANDLRAKQQELVQRDLKLQEQQKKYTEDFNKRTFEERQKIATLANIQLKDFAIKENISIIVQKAAYIDPASDITNQIISLLDGKQTIDNVIFQGPKNSKVLVLNPTRFYQSFGVAIGENLTAKQKNDQDELTTKGNNALKLIAEKNKIDIVLQEAAYLSQTSDLTTKLISVVKNSTLDSSSLDIDNLDSLTTMAAINSEKFFSSFPNKNRIKLAEAGNVALYKFSQERRINIILQEAAYISSSHDVTANVIKLIIPPVENEVGQTSNNNVLATTPTMNLADAKAKCVDLGFKSGTEGFGKCVLQLSK